MSTPMPEPAPDHAQRIPLAQIARTFLLFGIIGFGGPAAHIALMERELVARRRWLSRDHFLSLLAAINLVPGPNSTEMAFHIGLVTGGFWGCVLAGLGFIVPAVIFSVILAIIYVEAGTLPAVQGVLVGVKPIILVLILSAAYRLGAKALDNPPIRVLFGGALLVCALTVVPLMSLIGQAPARLSELLLLLVTGLLYMLYRRRFSAALAVFAPLIGAAAQAVEMIRPMAFDLFGRFFLIGATLFGSGYILAAYMERAFVIETGWLTPQQLIDTLAIGQSTPGPVLSTSAAAGYVMTVAPGEPGGPMDRLSGIPGAVLSAVGVFLPAFLIVLMLGRVVPVLQRFPAALDFLKGVNAGVIALLVATFVNLAWATLVRPDGAVDWPSVALTALAFFASERLNWTPLALVTVGIGVGLARAALGWGGW